MAVKSLVKACRLLSDLATSGEPEPLHILARRQSLPASTAFRLLETLCQEGLVEQMPDRRYRVGVLAFGLARVAQATRSVMKAAEPVMASLAGDVGESVSLVLFTGTAAHYVRCIESPRTLRMVPPQLGTRLPLHCTASGKLLLASLPEEQCHRIVERLPLIASTPFTLTDPERLLAEVVRVREQGYAVDEQEFEEGLICLAAPVHDARDGTVAGLSVSGHVSRLTGEARETVLAALRQAASDLSAELGGRSRAKVRSLPVRAHATNW